MSTIKDRIKQIMDRERLTAGAFAESIGVAQATISHILGERNKYPSTEVVLRLHQRYPNISLEWLLTGEGAMDNSIGPTPPSSATDYPLFGSEETDADTLTSPQQTPQVEHTRIIYRERPKRCITEIRIFFDDNTYETFTPDK